MQDSFVPILVHQSQMLSWAISSPSQASRPGFSPAVTRAWMLWVLLTGGYECCVNPHRVSESLAQL